MGDKTNIEWSDATWNPVVGCERVSSGCDNCYAAALTAGRLSHLSDYAGLAVKPEGGPAEFTGEIRLLPDRLGQPLRWRKPRRVFVNSMSDLFHPDVPDDFLLQVWEVMHDAHKTHGHIFQVLTKRPQHMARRLGPNGIGWYAVEGPVPCPEPGIWLGTSIEDDRYAFRADHLRNTPAAVRFVSAEPLLGPLPSLDLTDIDWLIVGGESGPGARPMHPNWVRDLRDRCIALDDAIRFGGDVAPAFFFKQYGEWVEDVTVDDDGCRHLGRVPDGTDPRRCAMHPAGMTALTPDNQFNPFRAGHPNWTVMARVGKKAAGRVLDGRTWDEYPAGDRAMMG